MGVSGNVVELFSSIQGEGVFAGRRQVFVRLAGCCYGCEYCDQPEAKVVAPSALIEQHPGLGDFAETPNPVDAEALANLAGALDRPLGMHHAFSITGGEPLEQPDFLAELLPLLRRCGPKIMLESNGVEVEALERVMPWVDVVSMDYKLASSTGMPAPAERHRRFLALARKRDVFVKMVVCAVSTDPEVGEAAQQIAEEGRDVPLILQPITQRDGGPGPPSAADLLRLHAVASKHLTDVRVLPQIHGMMNLR